MNERGALRMPDYLGQAIYQKSTRFECWVGRERMTAPTYWELCQLIKKYLEANRVP